MQPIMVVLFNSSIQKNWIMWFWNSVANISWVNFHENFHNSISVWVVNAVLFCFYTTAMKFGNIFFSSFAECLWTIALSLGFSTACETLSDLKANLRKIYLNPKVSVSCLYWLKCDKNSEISLSCMILQIIFCLI